MTYGRIVVTHRPQKPEPNRSRLTVGGDRLDSPVDTATPTADLTKIKLLWNFVISTPGARYVTMDVKNFYLNTPFDYYQYIRLQLSLIPQEIIDHYNLKDIENDGYVYCQIQKGMYGLAEAGILANQLLSSRLERACYYQCQFTSSLWRHTWRPITFTLVVDDFGVKFEGECHANHLKKVLEQY